MKVQIPVYEEDLIAELKNKCFLCPVAVATNRALKPEFCARVDLTYMHNGSEVAVYSGTDRGRVREIGVMERDLKLEFMYFPDTKEVRVFMLDFDNGHPCLFNDEDFKSARVLTFHLEAHESKIKRMFRSEYIV